MQTTLLTKKLIKNIENEIQKKIDEYVKSVTSILTISHDFVQIKRKLEEMMVIRVDRKIVSKEK